MDAILETLQAILSNEAVLLPLITFLLSLVPGPFRGVVNSLIGWLIQRAQRELANRKQQAAHNAVLAVEQIASGDRKMTGSQKKDLAMKLTQNAVPMDALEADALIEAEVKEMKTITVPAQPQHDPAIDKRLDELEAMLKANY
jgi:hypothetical protein